MVLDEGSYRTGPIPPGARRVGWQPGLERFVRRFLDDTDEMSASMRIRGEPDTRRVRDQWRQRARRELDKRAPHLDVSVSFCLDDDGQLWMSLTRAALTTPHQTGTVEVSARAT